MPPKVRTPNRRWGWDGRPAQKGVFSESSLKVNVLVMQTRQVTLASSHPRKMGQSRSELLPQQAHCRAGGAVPRPRGCVLCSQSHQV